MTEVRANKPVPITLKQTLCHFGTFENRITPVSRIFTFCKANATAKMVKKKFRKLALLVYLDQAGYDERRECDRATGALS